MGANLKKNEFVGARDSIYIPRLLECRIDVYVFVLFSFLDIHQLFTSCTRQTG